MTERPSRPPDISIPLQLPTEETIDRLHEISRSHSDADVRLLAAIVARLCPAIEAVAKAFPTVASGGFASLDPDVEEEGPERR